MHVIYASNYHKHFLNNSHSLQTAHLYVINFMKDTSHEKIYITDKGYTHAHTHTNIYLSTH